MVDRPERLDELAQRAGVQRLPSGKVRERFTVPGDRLLLVTTDRISAFDVVLPTPIPDRGKVLTALTELWLRGPLATETPHHLVTTDPASCPQPIPAFAEDLAGRMMLCRRAEMVPVECIARGYLAGSAWREYQEAGTVGGERMPDGLRLGEPLDPPRFTPTTKAASGHDEPIGFDEVAERVGGPVAEQLRERTLRLYRVMAEHAARRGLLLADTKLELGWIDGELAVCDEVGTCDSSRYWPAEGHTPGQAPASYDKQIVRDWLESTAWDKVPPGPPLPEWVVDRTRQRYIEVYERLAERPFLAGGA